MGYSGYVMPDYGVTYWAAELALKPRAFSIFWLLFYVNYCNFVILFDLVHDQQ